MKLTDIQKIEIIDKYLNTNTNCSQLAREYNYDVSSLRKFLVRRGIKIRKVTNNKYIVDESYFDTIDTEAKAYFLGLLYADGYNQETDNTIRLQLIEPDKHILEKFNSEIKTDRPLYYQPYDGIQNTWITIIRSKHMSEQLKNKGCWQKKSLTLQWPQTNTIPDKLMNHFIRGYFDGDGSIYVGEKQYHIRCISTIMFLKQLQKYIKVKLGLDGSIFYDKRSTNNITAYYGHGGKHANIFLDWLYQDATVYLDRKYQKYQSILSR